MSRQVAASKTKQPLSEVRKANAAKARAARLSETSLREQASSKSKRKSAREPIPRDKSYPIEVFQKLAGLSDTALMAARRAGLKVKKVGDSAWVTGEEWFRWLNQAAESTQLK